MKIALIRERKQPADLRAALTPEQAAALNRSSEEVQVFIESSPERIFSDELYEANGVEVLEDVSECEVMLGVKEVPIEHLQEGKTYLFFSHTIKKQPYNRKLLQAIVEKNIRLIDYECLSWAKGGRILGFGRWAGIVGVYNGFLTWGKKYKTYDLKPAHMCSGYDELQHELHKVVLPAIKIGLTGSGRVAGGAREVLEFMGLREVHPSALKDDHFEEAVFACFDDKHIYHRKDRDPNWDQMHFYENHGAYDAHFLPYTSHLDLLINGMYWEDDLPPLFHKNDTSNPDFRIKVIADITCDVEGSVPITMKATPINDPVLGWDKEKLIEVPPYLEDTIDVMAVTNLPTELPADASHDFGSVLLKEVLPLIYNKDQDDIIKRATITENGKLTEEFSYLQDYLDGH